MAANGAIGVLYVDFINSGPATIFRHRFARSFNNGATWTRQTLQSMDPGPIFNAASGFLWGDYEGLTAQGNTFFGVFTGQSMNRTQLQLDPIFFTETAVVPLLTADDPGRFNLRLDGTVRASSVGNGGTTGGLVVSAGTHTVSETAAPGTILANYTPTIGGHCAANGTVTVAAGESKTCTITNVHKPLTPEEACAAECEKEREDCIDGVGQPGNPTAAQCLQAFHACESKC